MKRGMVKWQPFASLPEQANYIKRVLYEHNKQEKPELSIEQLEELNKQILEAYHSGALVMITYYHDGYVYLVEGVIEKIDPIHQGIVIKNGEQSGHFAFSNIISIQIG